MAVHVLVIYGNEVGLMELCLQWRHSRMVFKVWKLWLKMVLSFHSVL